MDHMRISGTEHYASRGISDPVFYGDLVHKLKRVKGTANVISSGSKTVKRRRRQYGPVITERTIGHVHDHCAAMYISFLKH